jgi:hypothetical protein
VFCIFVGYNQLSAPMKARLTLTIEQSVIDKARIYAKGKGTSLSLIIENYLQMIAPDDVNSGIEITPAVKLLKGSFKAPVDFDYKLELEKGLTEKYQ